MAYELQPRAKQGFYSRRGRKLPDGVYNMPCYVCGNPVRLDRPAFMVHFGWGGGFAVTDAENEQDPRGDLAWWPVGPECLRKQPELRKYGRKEQPITE